MAIQLLQKKEHQEVAVYIVVFAIILAGLIHFVGVDFDFRQPEVVLEGRGNFFEIKTTLDQIGQRHNLAGFRGFTPISVFKGVSGRPNPFRANGIGIINDSPAEIEDREVVTN